MGTLIIVGLLSGIITAVSPCVLPVLPAILASTAAPPGLAASRGSKVGAQAAGKVGAQLGSKVGAQVGAKAAPAKASAGAKKGGTAVAEAPVEPPAKRGLGIRPLLIVGSLAASFALFTLVGGSLLSALNLPPDVLRWVGVAVIGILGLSLLIPGVAHLLERPFTFSWMPQLNSSGNAVLLGAGLGLVFVPCAGPILALITVLAATNGLSWGLVAITLAFAVGVSIPLLIFAYGGQAIAARVKATRERLTTIRTVAGIILVLTALGTAFNWFEPLQRAVPAALDEIQKKIEGSDSVQAEIDNLTGRKDVGDVVASGDALTYNECEDAGGDVLRNCGPAREFPGITQWLNTPGNQPLTDADLEGKVVLVDFWTYSCINCQRTFPYLTEWHDRYADDGLVIVGVHTPEFAFEKSVSNVEDATERFGIDYAVAMDNDFNTWTEWDQRFWPAHYLIDKTGTVRQVHYGEGGYADTERLIQELLDADPLPPVEAPPSGGTGGRTQESYLGYARLQYLYNESGNALEDFPFEQIPEPPLHTFSLGGTWFIDEEYARSVSDSSLVLHFMAKDAFLVLGGEGTVTVTRDGDPGWSNVIQVSGSPKLYTLYSGEPIEDFLRLDFTPGVEGYAFTFG